MIDKKNNPEEEKVEDANGREIKAGDELIAAEDIEKGFTDGGRTPIIVFKKGEAVTAEDICWDEPAQGGKVIIGKDDFDSYLFVKERRK